jgi:hypothetical protein
MDLGVEFDLRDHSNKIVMSHDPFSTGEFFDEYIQYVNDRFLIVNVKSEGVERVALDVLKKYSKTNYFFLDLSFPALVKLSQIGEKNLSARFSKYEPIEAVQKMKPLISWVWVDYFDKEGITEDNLKRFHDWGLKVCLVSPELLKENKPEDIKIYARSFINEKPDMICTKNPEVWKQCLFG